MRLGSNPERALKLRNHGPEPEIYIFKLSRILAKKR
jgi:hypothetical protein